MAALFFLLTFLIVPFAQALDVALAAAGAPYAPTDISKSRDPYVPLSGSERREILREFRALLSMGARPFAYSEWEGRDISDCVTSSGEKKCEIMMGQTRAEYLFGSRSGVQRVRGMEVRIDSTDKGLLKELKPAAQRYVGSLGQFYIEENQSGDSYYRFSWSASR